MKNLFNAKSMSWKLREIAGCFLSGAFRKVPTGSRMVTIPMTSLRLPDDVIVSDGVITFQILFVLEFLSERAFNIPMSYRSRPIMLYVYRVYTGS